MRTRTRGCVRSLRPPREREKGPENVHARANGRIQHVIRWQRPGPVGPGLGGVNDRRHACIRAPGKQPATRHHRHMHIDSNLLCVCLPCSDTVGGPTVPCVCDCVRISRLISRPPACPVEHRDGLAGRKKHALAFPTARCRPDSRRVLFTVVYRSTGPPGTVAAHRSTIKTTIKTLETRP